MINEPPSPPKNPVRRRTLVGLVPLVAGGLLLATTAQPASAATQASAADPAPECLADLLGP
ncbi:hypothetical protein [Micromonospora rubida]|uniref:hypothetical protein n=1 Tax=Micromonospora rubida TaxID=2697657 RepID=UPI0013785344|nr:hypothetical protein [Micromonospora rubida]NBE82695.1 hypothetical protein [Micromonospora rubida]